MDADIVRTKFSSLAFKMDLLAVPALILIFSIRRFSGAFPDLLRCKLNDERDYVPNGDATAEPVLEVFQLG